MQAAIADISQPIIGFDFTRKYKINLEWEGDELTLFDRKAQIRAKLQFAAIEHASVPTTQAVEILTDIPDFVVPHVDSIAFQIDAIKSLKEENLEELQKIPQEYQDILNKFPELLEPNFKDQPNKQGISHFIDTSGHQPCKAKPRKLMPGSPREVEGKKAFMELVELGIVEPVDTSQPCNWSSALHLQPKPSGGWRPVGDFRDLNKRTILDKYPLPLLRNFTGKLRGSKYFSKVDMKLAFHHIDVDISCRQKTATLTTGSIPVEKTPYGTSQLSTKLSTLDGCSFRGS